MVAAPAVDHAIENAKKFPKLNVGLHLVLSNGIAKLSASEIPNLVNNAGEFQINKFYSGINFFFNIKARKQLKREIRAQFEAYKKTGLKLDHVNAHNHMHLHPTVFNLIIEIGRDYDLTAIRIPNEPPLNSIINNKKEFIVRHLRWIFFMFFTFSMKKKCIKNNINFNDTIYGLHDSGHMNIEKLIRIIPHITNGITEIYTHPATKNNHSDYSESYKYEFEAEYKALIHARTKRTIDKFNIELSGFNS
tara:strand:+ start:570 stop:1313 length:744 start_codon:yes stop_codon:yes gene_type:complete